MKQFDVTLIYATKDTYPELIHTIHRQYRFETHQELVNAANKDSWWESIHWFGRELKLRVQDIYESEYDPKGLPLTRALEEHTVSGRAYFTGKGNAQEVDRDGA